MKPGTCVRVTRGLFKSQEFVVGNTIGVRPSLESGTNKEFHIRQDALEVIGENVEGELYQALENLFTKCEHAGWWMEPHGVGVMDEAGRVLVKYAPGKEKTG